MARGFMKTMKYFDSILIFLVLINIVSCYKNSSNQNEKVNADLDSSTKKLSKIVQDLRGEHIFSFNINPDLPEFKFVLRGDSEYNVIDQIIIYQSTDLIPIQAISVYQGESPLRDEEYFFAKDFNFDGYKDIALLNYWGSSANRFYTVWIYNKLKNTFEKDDFFEEISSPEPDTTKKQLTTYFKYSDGEYLISTYQYIGNKYELIIEEKYWRKQYENGYDAMKDSSIVNNDSLKLVIRKILESKNY